MAVARTDVTDKQQTDIENAEFENSVPVFMNDKTRVIIKGNNGGAERVAHEAGKLNRNAGVVMPASTKSGLFMEEKIGRA